MPFGDRTGPNGLGPRTGRGLGYCGGYDSPGYLRGFGRGFGFRRGAGRGRGWQAPAYPGYAPQPMDKQEEKKILEAELKNLEQEKKALEKRIKELEKQ